MLKSKVSGLPGNWGAWVRLQFQWPCSLLWIPHHGLLGGQEQLCPCCVPSPCCGQAVAACSREQPGAVSLAAGSQ